MAEDDVHTRSSPYTLHRKTSALARRRDRRSVLLMNFDADDSDVGAAANATANAITTAIKEMEESEDDEEEEEDEIPGLVARGTISRLNSQTSILTGEESSRPPSPDERTNDDEELPEKGKFKRAVGDIISSRRLTESVMTNAEHIKTDSDAMANATILAWKGGRPTSRASCTPVPEYESHTPPREEFEPHRPAAIGLERQSSRRSFRRDAILGNGILETFKQMAENDEFDNDEGADNTAGVGNELHAPPPDEIEPHRPAAIGIERQSSRRSFRRDAILGDGILETFKQMAENDEFDNDEGAHNTAGVGIVSRDSFSGFSETSTEIFLRKDRSTVPDYKGFTGLRQVCNIVMLAGRSDRKWDQVRDYLKNLSKDMARIACETREGVDGETPLHLACRHKPPVDVVKKLLRGSTLPASWINKEDHCLPLHYECHNGSDEKIVRMLIDAYPESTSVADKMGRTPLHVACMNEIAPPTFAILRLLMTMESITSRTNNEEKPLDIKYLANRAGNISADAIAEQRYAKECLYKFLDASLEDGVRPGINDCREFIATLEESCSWFSEHALHHPYVHAILNLRITENFPTVVLALDLYCLFMLIICFRLASFQALKAHGLSTFAECEIGTDGTQYCSAASSVAISFLVPLYGGVGYLILRELLQMISLTRRGDFAREWLFDIWNWLDCLCIGMVLRSTVIMHYGTEDVAMLKNLVVFSTGVLWMMVLSFLKLLRREFAVFVMGVVRVTLTLGSFLMTLGIFLIGFAQMYFSDSLGTSDCAQKPTQSWIVSDFCSIRGSYLRVFMMLAGGGVQEEDFTKNRTSLFLSVTFAFLVIILLLNVLIAIVTDSYQEVKRHGETVFWSHRQGFVFEVDQIGLLIQDYFVSPLLERRRLRRKRQLEKDENMDECELPDLLGAHGKLHDTTGHQWNKQLRNLWDICLISYEDPFNFAVFKKKKFLQRNWSGPKIFFGELHNPLVSPEKVHSCYTMRLIGALLIPIWMVCGVLTAGLLLPPQVRKLILCTDLTEESNGEDAATSDDIENVRVELRDGIKHSEDAMDAKLEDIKGSIEDMKNDMGEKMNSLMELLSEMSIELAQNTPTRQ